MATKSKSKTRRTSQSYRSEDSGSGGGLHGRMRSAANNGIHVKAEMANAKVARIIIEIEWAKLISRVAKKVSRAKTRAARGTGRTSRAAASS